MPKMKPNKSVRSRFKVTKTGKIKRHHSYTSHLLSGRTSKRKRKLGRPAILCETLAGNVRRMLGVEGRNPNRTAHQRRLRAQEQAKAAAPAASA